MKEYLVVTILATGEKEIVHIRQSHLYEIHYKEGSALPTNSVEGPFTYSEARAKLKGVM